MQNRFASGGSVATATGTSTPERQSETGVAIGAGQRYVSVNFLATYWDVHPNTVYRDIRKGALPARRLPGGQFRVRWIDARRYGRPYE